MEDPDESRVCIPAEVFEAVQSSHTLLVVSLYTQESWFSQCIPRCCTYENRSTGLNGMEHDKKPTIEFRKYPRIAGYAFDL
jgi:hypothetical protein